MKKTENLSSLEENLRQQLEEIEAQKKQALEQEKQEKQGLIAVYLNEAAGFRNQASKTTDDAEKQKLYSFAENSEREAKLLQVELGIVSEETFIQETEEKKEKDKLSIIRKINGLFLKCFFCLAAFFLSDFTSSHIEAGFFSFILKSISQLAWFLSLAFLGIWLACSILFRFVSEYILLNVRNDFKAISPGVRIGFLTVILAALLHFLTSIIRYGIL